ncbi:glycoside hydrolase family protein [candidate division KSB1 bacterium]|nr:glycoside hydrolase family protein [candidate division KSB1 bacterium]NIV68752.1 glycoside hydrolase family protein [Phycisphaerae bacterium]NIS25469.1 glycoside hydrolase family protein [candidate division KSB1 bacterium]NIT72362.1 glycoside hydrolase family protein [candidate division KSB1 bacterium]NIU26146.1 glycoside hydrolase family protein [candidate division KSB1 bacterium]
MIVDDLIRDEGFRPYAYRDSEGYLTIGIGFLIDPEHKGRVPMPKNVAMLWLLDILNGRKKELDQRLPWWRDLDADRQRALLNMSYQLGVTGLLKFQRMLVALKAKDYYNAAKEALDSKWAKQTPARAKRVATLLRGEEHETIGNQESR